MPDDAKLCWITREQRDALKLAHTPPPRRCWSQADEELLSATRSIEAAFDASPAPVEHPTIDWCVRHGQTNSECCAESGHRDPPWRYLAACRIIRVPLPLHLGIEVTAASEFEQTRRGRRLVAPVLLDASPSDATSETTT